MPDEYFWGSALLAQERKFNKGQLSRSGVVGARPGGTWAILARFLGDGVAVTTGADSQSLASALPEAD